MPDPYSPPVDALRVSLNEKFDSDRGFLDRFLTNPSKALRSLRPAIAADLRAEFLKTLGDLKRGTGEAAPALLKRLQLVTNASYRAAQAASGGLGVIQQSQVARPDHDDVILQIDEAQLKDIVGAILTSKSMQRQATEQIVQFARAQNMDADVIRNLTVSFLEPTLVFDNLQEKVVMVEIFTEVRSIPTSDVFTLRSRFRGTLKVLKAANGGSFVGFRTAATPGTSERHIQVSHKTVTGSGGDNEKRFAIPMRAAVQTLLIGMKEIPLSPVLEPDPTKMGGIAFEKIDFTLSSVAPRRVLTVFAIAMAEQRLTLAQINTAQRTSMKDAKPEFANDRFEQAVTLRGENYSITSAFDPNKAKWKLKPPAQPDDLRFVTLEFPPRTITLSIERKPSGGGAPEKAMLKAKISWLLHVALTFEGTHPVADFSDPKTTKITGFEVTETALEPAGFMGSDLNQAALVKAVEKALTKHLQKWKVGTKRFPIKHPVTQIRWITPAINTDNKLDGAKVLTASGNSINRKAPPNFGSDSKVDLIGTEDGIGFFVSPFLAIPKVEELINRIPADLKRATNGSVEMKRFSFSIGKDSIELKGEFTAAGVTLEFDGKVALTIDPETGKPVLDQQIDVHQPWWTVMLSVIFIVLAAALAAVTVVGAVALAPAASAVALGVFGSLGALGLTAGGIVSAVVGGEIAGNASKMLDEQGFSSFPFPTIDALFKNVVPIPGGDPRDQPACLFRASRAVAGTVGLHIGGRMLCAEEASPVGKKVAELRVTRTGNYRHGRITGLLLDNGAFLTVPEIAVLDHLGCLTIQDVAICRSRKYGYYLRRHPDAELSNNLENLRLVGT